MSQAEINIDEVIDLRKANGWPWRSIAEYLGVSYRKLMEAVDEWKIKEQYGEVPEL